VALVSSARNEELHNLRIEKLQSDITNLLELIRRVREDNSWDATRLTFNEVTNEEDILGNEDINSSSSCRHMVGSVCDSQISATISISVETTHSTHQNQVYAPVPASYK
jgi:hypothetical protein